MEYSELAKQLRINELLYIIDFCKINVADNKVINVSLKDNMSMKDLNCYFPYLKRKDVVSLFDFIADNGEYAFRELKSQKVI